MNVSAIEWFIIGLSEHEEDHNDGQRFEDDIAGVAAQVTR